MQLHISRELLLHALSAVANAVDRKPAMSVLSNIKFELSEDRLVLTGSDLEVELTSTLVFSEAGACIKPGAITLPARKLIELCKKLPAGSKVDLIVEDNEKCTLKSGLSRFSLGTLPAEEYPALGNPEHTVDVGVARQKLRSLIEKTSFAMAVQDVRFYLTGMLIEAEHNEIRTVATDGHRLAVSKAPSTKELEDRVHAVVPRKAVNELVRLLGADDDDINLVFGRELFQVELNINENFENNEGESLTVRFTSRLIDGKYPDYRRVIPDNSDKIAEVDKEILKSVLERVVILSNEKSRGIVFDFLGDGNARISAHNSVQDEAQEDITLDYKGEPVELSFNASYLLDVVNTLPNKVRINMKTSTSSVLINESDDADNQYVIMPMRI